MTNAKNKSILQTLIKELNGKPTHSEGQIWYYFCNFKPLNLPSIQCGRSQQFAGFPLFSSRMHLLQFAMHNNLLQHPQFSWCLVEHI